MKSIACFIVLTALAISPLFAQEAVTHRVTQRIEQDWGGQDWINQLRITTRYNQDGQPDSVLYHNWVDGAWAIDVRGWYTYDDNGTSTSNFQFWDGMTWTDRNRSLWTYDEAGNLLERIDERWNNGAWEPRSRRASTYDESGNKLTELSQVPDGDGWADSKRWSWTYDEDGKVLENLSESLTESGWVNDDLLTVTYDEAGNRAQDTWQAWDGTQWLNSWREGYEHDSNGYAVSYLYEEWVDGAWKPDYRSTYTIDGRGNVLESVGETMGESGWVNADLTSRTYVEGGSVFTESVRQRWDGAAWVNRDRVLQEVEATTPTAISDDRGRLDLPQTISLGQNYPNPFNPSTQFSYSLSEASEIRVTILDVLGREVAQLVNGTVSAGEHVVSWSPGTRVGNGVYLYQLEVLGPNGAQKKTRSMLLAK